MISKKPIYFLIILFSLLSFCLYLTFWHKDITQKIEVYSSGIEYPLWLLDIDNLDLLSTVILKDKEFCHIEIFDQNGNLLLEKGKKKIFSIRYSKAAFFEDIIIGTIYFDISLNRVISTFLYILLISLSFMIIASLYFKNAEKNEKLLELNEELSETNEELEQTIRELEQTQESLIISEKMAALGKLMLSVAHDINTPIGIIFTASTEIENILESNITDKETLKQLSKIIIKNSQKIAEIISSLKKTAIHEVSDNFSKFNIKELVEDIVDTLSFNLKKNNIKTIIDVDDKNVFSNPGAIAQILMNLINNTVDHAFKSEKAEKIISISAEVNKKHLKIIVSDNGVGIDEKIQRKIFDPFFTTDKEKGTGLGLSIVHQLVVKLLKGHIEVKSNKGKGTTFIIIIPLKEENNG
ncbi:sensor histidine kinase [Thermosipho globiformans]|uniref:sensor histidine kinase n=1 Tax=Thermosipho globiformans TaxID=380685 RepID=UPI001F49FE9E|nr:HAMP domain-containing sensor histidine kinase [Thermosipho globiformans]